MDQNEGQGPTSLPSANITSNGHSPEGSPAQRIISLDVLRGIALLGALFVSVWLFGGFSINKQTQLLTHPSGGNYSLFATVSLLLEGKMRALIALVYGASMLLLFAKYNAANKSKSADFFMRRQIWLIGFGIVNGVVLLNTNDLLFQLGIMGILLFPFMRLQPKKMIIAATVCLLIFCGKTYWNYAENKTDYKKYVAVTLVEKKFKKDSADRHQKDSLAGIGKSAQQLIAGKDSLSAIAKKDTLTKEQASDKAKWEGLVKGMKYDPKKDDEEKKAMRETSYGKIYNHLLQATQAREAAWTYRTGIWELGMMILLGMAMFKLGFFSNRYGSARYLLVALLAISIGLLLGWFRLHLQHATLNDYEKYISGHWFSYKQFIPLEVAAMAIGYASLIMWMLTLNSMSKLLAAFEAVGKLSLSNYLLQSIFFTLFFTGFGTGSYGKLTQWQLYVLVLEVCVAQMVFSVLWLRYYQQGPAEWLWRSAVQKKWLPFKKHADNADHSNVASTLS